jgi:hypothetical protein
MNRALSSEWTKSSNAWIPAFAGMTIALCLMISGCAAHRHTDLPAPTKPIKLVAVLEIQAATLGATSVSGDGEAQRRLPADAGRAVTGQIYSVLANRSDFRFVPDLTVSDTSKQPGIASGTLEDRARELGKAVASDGVIFGTVTRFDERVGTELGATTPASVHFELNLLETASDKIIWHGEYAKTQEALSSNLLQFWMFWENGPRWISARELARVGVQELLEDMRLAMQIEDPKRHWWQIF